MTNVLKTTDCIHLWRDRQKRVRSCDQTRERERENGGVLVYCSMPLPLKGSDCVSIWPKHTHGQTDVFHTHTSVLCCWWFGHTERTECFILCSESLVLHVCSHTWRACSWVLWVSEGVAGVRGQLHTCRSANRKTRALVQRWLCQKPHTRIVCAVINTLSLSFSCGDDGLMLLASWSFSWVWHFEDVIYTPRTLKHKHAFYFS